MLLMHSYLSIFAILLINVRPIFLSIPCLVVGMPVALAMLLLSTSTPNALPGENDVPGIPKIFMATLFFSSKLLVPSEANLRETNECCIMFPTPIYEQPSALDEAPLFTV